MNIKRFWFHQHPTREAKSNAPHLNVMKIITNVMKEGNVMPSNKRELDAPTTSKEKKIMLISWHATGNVKKLLSILISKVSLMLTKLRGCVIVANNTKREEKRVIFDLVSGHGTNINYLDEHPCRIEMDT